MARERLDRRRAPHSLDLDTELATQLPLSGTMDAGASVASGWSSTAGAVAVRREKRAGAEASLDGLERLRTLLQKRSSGSAPPEAVARAVEQATGLPLGEVRLHHGSDAASVAAALGARAVTVGSDVFLGAGEYSPDSQSGFALLAHELAHTYETPGPVSETQSLRIGGVAEPAEGWAHLVADRAAGLAETTGFGALPRSTGDLGLGGPHAAGVVVARRDPVPGTTTATATATDTTTGTTTATTTDDRKVQKDYRTWVEARVTEVAALQGDAKVQRVEGLLWQMEDTAFRIKAGETVDINGLSTTPTLGAARACGGVPPEWIDPGRALIAIIEQTIVGATGGPAAAAPATTPATTTAAPPTTAPPTTTSTTAPAPATTTTAPTRIAEGSLYSETDWNSRLGIPQYRTQSDNLASPEATCNGTSLAMALERLGVSRNQVVSACERAMGLTAESTDADRTAKWTEKVTAYLKAENERSSNYQKLRGKSTTDDTRKTWAGEFKANAQMEDVVLFLMYLKGIAPTEVNSNLDTILKSLDPDGKAGNVATFEKITTKPTWSDLKTKVKTTLEGGGSVILSLYHKGNKTGESSKTHIITVQRVDGDDFYVDDPYGKIREDYSHTASGDAYADAGSMTRKTKNEVDSTSTDTDWKLSAAQAPTATETKGKSVKITKKTVEESFFYLVLMKRPVATPATP